MPKPGSAPVAVGPRQPMPDDGTAQRQWTVTKLTPTQEKAFSKLSNKPESAYSIKTSLATLNALVKKGKAKDVTPHGPGAMFSPSTHHKFVRK